MSDDEKTNLVLVFFCFFEYYFGHWLSFVENSMNSTFSLFFCSWSIFFTTNSVKMTRELMMTMVVDTAHSVFRHLLS